jgi:ferredoxin-NADP reductase
MPGNMCTSESLPSATLRSPNLIHSTSYGGKKNDTDDQLSSITILAKVESGFTRRLASCSHNSLRVIVDGSYGKARETDHYDSFIFVSIGIGITAQLSYLKDLLTRRQRGYRLRRVCLIWQVEDKPMMIGYAVI